ncbi:MAG: hypothetical protein A2Y33_12375 [Spirochaetes bacterium GWF1_51_8]|nr:MAG: hypothetical protein A2Y33_12375 [Spirochaetes bacterium GWF1_51_8]
MEKPRKIMPHLWYDKEAKQAAELYTSVFKDSKVISSSTIHDTPSGDADILTIELQGQQFMMINAGPYFKFNPSISFLVACDTEEEVDFLWNKLADGGSVLMELGEYPFSKRYGWTTDKYGLSWQLMSADGRKIDQKITPTLLFVGAVAGRAEEAINFYGSVFRSFQTGGIMRYEKGEGPDKAGTIKHAEFSLEGMKFAAMDSALDHRFAFNEAISFIVNCDTQAEIDYYWDKLSADPSAEQCGWLKDKFGVSWQIVPSAMDEMLRGNDKERIARVTEAFLKMKKFDIAELRKAYEG